ncbi:uncharacterized protein [Amphiura filiformis]|uniref:uncharacterized protein n=1 Tax=Amphiura filiformis TaxID=82378 RepID=UPI003B22848C
MKLTLFLGFIALAGDFLTVNATWSDTTNTTDLEALVDSMIDRFQDTVALRDPALIVARYTNDTIYKRSGNAGKCDNDTSPGNVSETIAHGPEEVLQLYRDWFDSGVATVVLEWIDIGTLGPDYVYILLKLTAYDVRGEIVEWGNNLVIFRAEDGGFKTYLKTETLEYVRPRTPIYDEEEHEEMATTPKPKRKRNQKKTTRKMRIYQRGWRQHQSQHQDQDPRQDQEEEQEKIDPANTKTFLKRFK